MRRRCIAYGTIHQCVMPASRPNAALGSVTEFYSGSWSNYNGLQATASSRLSWLTLQLNYAYGHALDTTSNGGFNAFGVNAVEPGESPRDLSAELRQCRL